MCFGKMKREAKTEGLRKSGNRLQLGGGMGRDPRRKHRKPQQGDGAVSPDSDRVGDRQAGGWDVPLPPSN